MTNATITKPTGFTDTETTLSPRQERKIYNRTKYRLTKRRSLWVRSLAAAKKADKQVILKAKIEAIDFALATLEES